MQRDEHLLVVLRYVERNAVRANLRRRCRDWRWCGAGLRAANVPCEWLTLPTDWPVDVPRDWEKWVDQPQTAAEEAALLESIRRGKPFGSERWTRSTASKLALQSTLHPRGRPRATRANKDSRPLSPSDPFHPRARRGRRDRWSSCWHRGSGSGPKRSAAGRTMAPSANGGSRTAALDDPISFVACPRAASFGAPRLRRFEPAP